MAGLNETPKGDRVHIAFFGLRNAGKSTLVNKLTGQDVAIVSDVAGTTTDPVSKAMEILPLGPCLVTDTAGLDDEGPLGEMRVKKSLEVLATTDIAVWVEEGPSGRARSPSGPEGGRLGEATLPDGGRGATALPARGDTNRRRSRRSATLPGATCAGRPGPPRGGRSARGTASS